MPGERDTAETRLCQIARTEMPQQRTTGPFAKESSDPVRAIWRLIAKVTLRKGNSA
jgi:hypothetical protein